MTLKQFLFFLAVSSIFTACTTIKSVSNRKMMNKSLSNSPLFGSHLTGFALYDPADSSFLYTWNEDKYFTPASNTKLLTFYAGLTLMRDSLPGLRYILKGDSLFFTGTGDPTFLHPDFEDQPIYDLLMDLSLIHI